MEVMYNPQVMVVFLYMLLEERKLLVVQMQLVLEDVVQELHFQVVHLDLEVMVKDQQFHVIMEIQVPVVVVDTMVVALVLFMVQEVEEVVTRIHLQLILFIHRAIMLEMDF